MSLQNYFTFFKVNFRLLFIFIAPVVFSPILFIGTAAARCAFCILLMSSYWVVEVFPLGVTAFLPIIVLPILGVIPIRETSTAYMNDTNFLFMSSMLIALAVEDCGLHRRVALKFLAHVGTRPQWLMLGFMVITSFISLWISDTATAALMAPIAYALLETIMIPRMKEIVEIWPDGTQNTIIDSGPVKLDVKRLSPKDRGICKAMMLIVAHASLIGGTGTINATGPNLIFRQTLYERYPPEETGVTYFSWMAFQVPPMFLYMISSWLVVQIQFIGIKYVLRIFHRVTPEEAEEEKRTRSAVLKAYEELEPMSFAEKSCLFWFLVTIGLWISCDPKVVPGWVNLFEKGYASDALAGIMIAVIMFVWPKRKPRFIDQGFSREESYSENILSHGTLLDWSMVSRRFQWSIILLLGAGFAISRSVKMSGLASWIACQIDNNLSHLPLVWMQVIISILVVTMTEFSTNTSTASIFIPIAFNVAEKVGAHPLYFAIPCAIGPSFSFMLPMATSSNAIVYETKTISVMDMASCGIFLNIFCIFFTVLNMNTWAAWIFDLHTYPSYAPIYAANTTNTCL